MTLLMPFLVAALFLVPALLSEMGGKGKSVVAVVDYTHRYAPLLKDTENIHFVLEDSMKNTFRQEDSPYDAIVYITGDLTRDSNAATIISRGEVPGGVENYVNVKLTEQIRNDRLNTYRIANINEIVADAKTNTAIKTVRWDKNGGASLSSSSVAGGVGLVLSLLIYTFILTYGGMVMQGVMEEKTNRIVEIMVSSVKPWQLMFGKIAGIALTGLFQFLVWILMIGIILAIAGTATGGTVVPEGISSPATMGSPMLQTVTPEFLQIFGGMNIAGILLLFILYFIGGYLLFASAFAAIGASINEQQDAQQFMMPIVLVSIFALYAGMFSIENAQGSLSVWCSFIPFTSPIVMMVRIPLGIPAWQIILSLLILYGTAAIVLRFASGIYRVGILMYGRKPSFRDMLKWINYK